MLKCCIRDPTITCLRCCSTWSWAPWPLFKDTVMIRSLYMQTLAGEHIYSVSGCVYKRFMLVWTWNCCLSSWKPMGVVIVLRASQNSLHQHETQLRIWEINNLRSHQCQGTQLWETCKSISCNKNLSTYSNFEITNTLVILPINYLKVCLSGNVSLLCQEDTIVTIRVSAKVTTVIYWWWGNRSGLGL